MKKIIMLLSILFVTSCMKNNIEAETWIVWRAHDRVPFFNSPYDCHGYKIGTKVLSRDLDSKVNYTEHVDSLILYYVVPDSVDRDYIVWKHKLTNNE